MNTRTFTQVTSAVAVSLMLVLFTASARAGDVVTDDWFRDVQSAGAAASPPPDWFERAVPSRPAAPPPDWLERTAATATAPSVAPVAPTGPLADDWFRDPPAVGSAQPRGGGFDWADFAVGAASSLGGVLLAGLVAVALVTRRQHRPQRA